MPQKAPMYWTFLFTLLFFLMFIMFIMMINFIFSVIKLSFY